MAVLTKQSSRAAVQDPKHTVYSMWAAVIDLRLIQLGLAYCDSENVACSFDELHSPH